jgi:hypothetical protein
MKALLFGCLYMVCTLCAFGQKDTQKPPASSNTSRDAWIDSPSEKEKNYLSILKRDTQGTGIGNKCVEDQTKKMGFRYMLVPKQGPGSRTGAGVFLHNGGTKFLLFFRNGPLWTIRLKKKVKECRRKTGDYMG